MPLLLSSTLRATGAVQSCTAQEQWHTAEIERRHRTIGERINEEELKDLTRVKAVIAGIIDVYNHVRLQSAPSLLRPVDCYRGNPEALPVERRRKLQAAEELQQRKNIKLRQRLILWP